MDTTFAGGLIRPFAGLRPHPERATAVIAPPYDVLSSAEARERAQGHPDSFLHVSKPEIDLPPATDPYADAVYAQGRKQLDRLWREGVLQRDRAPYYYAYRLTMGNHAQTGLVAVASVAAYDQNRIRKHEYTRPQKEDDRVRHIDTLNAQTGPVFLAYRQDPDMGRLLREATQAPAEIDATAADGVRHELWVIREPDRIQALSQAVDAQPVLYIADGHHRSAAASRVAAERGPASETGSHHYFLSVLFPANEVQIWDYNRVVKDLNGLTSTDLLERLQTAFAVSAQRQAVRPDRRGVFGLYLAGQWYHLTLQPERVPAADPVASLDVALLAREVLEPVLGITDPRRDERIDFVGGIRGLAELERRVDSGEMAVAFSLFPTSLEDLMAVADAEQVMPPKSTWFEPKLADGLVSHVLD